VSGPKVERARSKYGGTTLKHAGKVGIFLFFKVPKVSSRKEFPVLVLLLLRSSVGVIDEVRTSPVFNFIFLV
jgi:hypothetical protein